jgi:uncharacterized membrane protein YdbT with pleckstrin-like domain
MANEQLVWKGTPSQVINIPTFVVCGLLFWLVIPIFIIVWKWLVVKTTTYEITTERLKTRYGILSKKLDELELYRVRDYKLEQPLFLRIFGLGNIILVTSDKSHPLITLRAIPNGERLRDQLRSAVEACRDKKRVREVDFE